MSDWTIIDRKHYDRQVATLGPRLAPPKLGRNQSGFLQVREGIRYKGGETGLVDIFSVDGKQRYGVTLLITWLPDRVLIRRWIEADRKEELFQTKEFSLGKPDGVIPSWIAYLEACHDSR